MDEEVIDTPIHRSLNRPVLLLGGERALVLMLALIAGIFILSLAKLWAAILGVALWMVGSWGLARAGRFDPQLSKTGLRSLRFQRHYAASATPFARQREIK